MEMAVAVLFGIGAPTLATVALLNVVCMRLYDVQEGAYVYDGQEARCARKGRFRYLPSFVGWWGVLAVFVVELYVLEISPNEESFGTLSDLAWIGMATYVISLLVFVAIAYGRVYRAMSESRPRSTPHLR